MKKYGKYIIALIAIICMIGIVVIYNRNYDKAQQTNSNLENMENSIALEEMKQNEKQNQIENLANEVTNTDNKTEIENQLEQSVVKNENTSISTVYEQDNDIGSTDKKQEAIHLVKLKWGEDDSVTFRCDHVESNGEYIIAVVSKNSASVKNYFRVNLEEKSVTVDY